MSSSDRGDEESTPRDEAFEAFKAHFGAVRSPKLDEPDDDSNENESDENESDETSSDGGSWFTEDEYEEFLKRVFYTQVAPSGQIQTNTNGSNIIPSCQTQANANGSNITNPGDEESTPRDEVFEACKAHFGAMRSPKLDESDDGSNENESDDESNGNESDDESDENGSDETSSGGSWFAGHEHEEFLRRAFYGPVVPPGQIQTDTNGSNIVPTGQTQTNTNGSNITNRVEGENASRNERFGAYKAGYTPRRLFEHSSESDDSYDPRRYGDGEIVPNRPYDSQVVPSGQTNTNGSNIVPTGQTQANTNGSNITNRVDEENASRNERFGAYEAGSNARRFEHSSESDDSYDDPRFYGDGEIVPNRPYDSQGVSCDSCLKGNFRGKRYKCLICYDYDLCATCYEAGSTTTRHTTDHPMQCILTRADYDLYFGGEALTIDQPQSFTCPFCGKLGFTEASLLEHVTAEHTDMSFEVVCPICAAVPIGDPNLVTDDFAGHLTLEHRNPSRDLISFLDEPQNRHNVCVRRTIPAPSSRSISSRARRSNIHFSSSGALASISPSSRDNVDPIAELLSQLSGVRRNQGSTPSQLQHLQMQLQLERQQVRAARQQLERMPRRPAGSQQVLVPVGNSPAIGLGSSTILSQDNSSQNPSQLLLTRYLESNLSDSEQENLEQERAGRSLFVQSLMLSTLNDDSFKSSKSSKLPLVTDITDKFSEAAVQDESVTPSPLVPTSRPPQRGSSTIQVGAVHTNTPQIPASPRRKPKHTDAPPPAH